MSKPKRRHLSADEQQILEQLQVRPLSSPKDTARCDQLIAQHHYLHDAALVGEQLRYVATYKGRWLALATWSGAAFHIKDRVEFIGRDPEQCRRRRPLLANNSRLLVLPECHRPNLISRFMKLMLGRLSQDWSSWTARSCGTAKGKSSTPSTARGSIWAGCSPRPRPTRFRWAATCSGAWI